VYTIALADVRGVLWQACVPTQYPQLNYSSKHAGLWRCETLAAGIGVIRGPHYLCESVWMVDSWSAGGPLFWPTEES
jgi:hypothetical protein